MKPSHDDGPATPETALDDLRRENALLSAELAMLRTSLRMRAADILADAMTSPYAALATPARLLRFVGEAIATRSWRRLIISLECGLPEDPLRELPAPNFNQRGKVRALYRAAGCNAPPPTNFVVSEGGPLSHALKRYRQLYALAQDGPTWPTRVAKKTRTQSVPPKILMALHAGEPDFVNGYTRRSHEILRALQAEHCNVTAILRQHGETIQPAKTLDDIHYDRLRPFTAQGDGISDYTQAYQMALREAVDRIKPDIIHAASNHITGFAAACAAREAGLPFIYEVRGLWEVTRASVEPGFRDTVGYAAQRRMEIEVAKNADRLLVNGSALSEVFQQAGIPENRIRIAHNGCTPGDFDKAAEIAPALRARWNLDERPVIGFVGSLTPYEGLMDVLTACQSLPMQSYQLLFVGDGPARPTLEAAVARLGLSAQTHFTGRVTPQEARASYGLIDIAPLVRPDTPVARLTPPLKPLDVMAGRSALVVSDLPPLREFAAEKRGIVVKPGDVNALTSTLGDLLSAPQKRAALATTARHWVETNRRWAHTAALIAKTYQEVL